MPTHFDEVAERLRRCDRDHLGGFVDLLRYGLHTATGARSASIAAAWLLNASRHRSLPQIAKYQLPDGTAFAHCDADWVEAKLQARLAKARLSQRDELITAIDAVGAQSLSTALDALSLDAFTHLLATQLEQRTAIAFVSTAADADLIGLALALDVPRHELLWCELSSGKARLAWRALGELKPAAGQRDGLELVCLPRATQSDAANVENTYRGGAVVYLDTPQGSRLLLEAEGLDVVLWAALHGQSQADVSSCQVASLSSLAVPKGVRQKMAQAAASTAGADADGGVQALLRAMAAKQLQEKKGQRFDYRGLSVAELAELAEGVGLIARPTTLSVGDEKRPMACQAFRAAARNALGLTVVNFSRAALQQMGGGHHSVVIAYHPDADMFLIDDPASFKTPPFWVETFVLMRGMATLDTTEGVGDFRGYVVLSSEVAGRLREGPSVSLVLPGPRGR